MKATLFTTFGGKTFHFSSTTAAIRFGIEWTKMMNEAGIINETNLKSALKKNLCRLFVD